jgi:hypothetical protein
LIDKLTYIFHLDKPKPRRGIATALSAVAIPLLGFSERYELRNLNESKPSSQKLRWFALVKTLNGRLMGDQI